MSIVNVYHNFLFKLTLIRNYCAKWLWPCQTVELHSSHTYTDLGRVQPLSLRWSRRYWVWNGLILTLLLTKHYLSICYGCIGKGRRRMKINNLFVLFLVSKSERSKQVHKFRGARRYWRRGQWSNDGQNVLLLGKQIQSNWLVQGSCHHLIQKLCAPRGLEDIKLWLRLTVSKIG